MRKTEMNEKQLKERAIVIERLYNSGWIEETANSLFEQDWNLDTEAVMAYQNDGTELVIQYCAEDNSVDFSINQGSDGLDFVIKFEDKIEEMLDKIVSFQNTISLDNYKAYIGQIMRICPLTYIVSDGNVVQLVDNKPKIDVAE